MLELGKTPKETPGDGDEGANAVDRVALAVTFAVAILIVVMFAMTYRSTAHQIPLAAAVAISSYAGGPVSKSDQRMPTTTARGR